MDDLQKNVHPEDVKALIWKQGTTLSALALAHQVDISTVSKSLREPIPAGNEIVAAYLGKSVHELWPEWFDSHGVRRCRPYRRKAIRRAVHVHD